MADKRAKVIMLPTEDKSRITKGEDNTMYWWQVAYKSETPKHTNQHLYFTTDEEIEEGDWCYDTKSNTIHKCTNIYPTGAIEINGLSGALNPKFARKIVATTDTSLKIGHDDTVPYPKRLSLPHPSQAFIEKFCRIGGIDEVMIEYRITGRCEDPMICLRGCSVHEGTCKHLLNKKELLHIASDNTITIRSIKDSWTKEEIAEIISGYFLENSDTSKVQLHTLVKDIMKEFK